MFHRFQLGDWLPLSISPKDANGSTSGTDDSVTVKIFDSAASLVETVKLAGRPQRISDLTNRGIQQFDGQVLLDSSYSAGHYLIFYAYTTDSGANVRGHCDSFEVVAGGNANGAAIGSYFHALPNANNLVYQLDGGILARQLNPR